MREPISVYIGYDPVAEPIAYHVCADSIIRNCSHPLRITPLALNNFKAFYQERHVDGSNQFIYSRFLIPYLERWTGFAIFLDGDMILRDGADLAELWAWRDPYKALQCVQHSYTTKYPNKYLGAKNEDYPRKNWSSVVIWNCASYINRVLTPDFVAQQPGSYLHRFKWAPDDRIGDLPEEWNRLVLEQDVTPADKLLHYTIGTPCFPDYAVGSEADEWHRAKAKAISYLER